VTTLRVRHTDEAEKTPFHYTACGLDDVYLTNGYEIEKTSHGTGVSIRKVDEVLRAIGIFLVANKKQLSGKEIRFLRHQMDYTQSELARMLGVSSQQVARYEKDKNGSSISGASDRILRLLYREHVHDRVPIKDTLEGVDQMDDRVHRRMMFQHVNGTWKQAV
jgi:putative transcriptional regulator